MSIRSRRHSPPRARAGRRAGPFGPADDHGMTLVELCIVIVILGILLVTAVAGFGRARVSSNEASAIASVRAIYSAQFSFAAGCGQGGYATTLVS